MGNYSEGAVYKVPREPQTHHVLEGLAILQQLPAVRHQVALQAIAAPLDLGVQLLLQVGLHLRGHAELRRLQRDGALRGHGQFDVEQPLGEERVRPVAARRGQAGRLVGQLWLFAVDTGIAQTNDHKKGGVQAIYLHLNYWINLPVERCFFCIRIKTHEKVMVY